MCSTGRLPGTGTGLNNRIALKGAVRMMLFSTPGELPLSVKCKVFLDRGSLFIGQGGVKRVKTESRVNAIEVNLPQRDFRLKHVYPIP